MLFFFTLILSLISGLVFLYLLPTSPSPSSPQDLGEKKKTREKKPDKTEGQEKAPEITPRRQEQEPMPLPSESKPLVEDIGQALEQEEIDSLERMKQQYLSKLPGFMTSKITPEGSFKEGIRVLIELKNSRTDEQTSYNALIEHGTGRVISTWNRKIVH